MPVAQDRGLGRPGGTAGVQQDGRGVGIHGPVPELGRIGAAGRIVEKVVPLDDIQPVDPGQPVHASGIGHHQSRCGPLGQPVEIVVGEPVVDGQVGNAGPSRSEQSNRQDDAGLVAQHQALSPRCSQAPGERRRRLPSPQRR